jgi:predicted nucleotidyltransferase
VGIEQVFKAFGFLAVLHNVSQRVGLPEDELLKWSVRRFYTKTKLLAWLDHAEKEYRNQVFGKK